MSSIQADRRSSSRAATAASPVLSSASSSGRALDWEVASAAAAVAATAAVPSAAASSSSSSSALRRISLPPPASPSAASASTAPFSTVEWPVVKTNERGKRQDRILRLTATQIQNCRGSHGDTVSSKFSYDEVLCVTLQDLDATLVISYLSSHDRSYSSPLARAIASEILRRVNERKRQIDPHAVEIGLDSHLLRVSPSLPDSGSPFDPERAHTPASKANSPMANGMHGERTMSAGELPPPMLSAAAASRSLGGLPILSMPALPGQRVCECMRAVTDSLQGFAPSTPSSASSPPPSASLLTPGTPSGPQQCSLDRVLPLADRFWLEVGEVDLHGDALSVERGVDAMETVAVKLTHMCQQLSHQSAFLRDEQLRGGEALMAECESKNSELVDFLQHMRGEESLVRERIDALSAKVDKATKTVDLSVGLSLASAKQQREIVHLDTVRGQLNIAQKHLEQIVAQRTHCQSQMLNVSTIVAQCRIVDMDRRDYRLLYKQVQASFFQRSFGALYQHQCDTLVKVMAKLREQSHECMRRKRFLEHTIHELRARIALVVSAHWK